VTWTAALSLCTVVGVDELVFEVTQEADGGFAAECLSETIFTQADSWDELRDNVRDAVRGYCFDKTMPRHIRLHAS